MRNKHVIAVLSLSLLFSSASVFAADLEKDMDTLKDGLSVVKKTSDAQEMHTALGKMRQAATDAKQSTPEKLEGQAADSAQIKDYHAGLDSLIAQIDVVDQLAQANKLDEAKAEAKKLEDIRNANHKKFR
ncbi:MULTISPECIES: cytochrome b562 [Pantoea]|jgi:soluble cytochrome b562|uniref:Cytochrome b562 n=1 Tax=Pantoea sp. BJ2 TaxID=3141322 RepID=A0AAU7TU87_9GAMM|nr:MULTISPECIES: cytochrome b562 [Pantoea]MBD9643731.1 cytochrome b562 [Pantoea sp. PNT02]MBY4838627.1 cytochrome b562 [Pantoea sp. DY-5]MBY4889874.1 cytochrome b562 [Pantoea sp. DY-15]MDR6348918.1 soluble cytochrome b562 [Pantoea sp. SORGH_AS_0659]PYG48805.1 soluble cytochrome b562 [Pantoea sp. AG1095]